MSEHIIKFKKPITWEGKEYTEIDLSGIKNLKVKDAIEVQKQLFDEQEAAAALICETTSAFARNIASRATGIPVEFFKLMPMGASRQVNLEVQSCLSATKPTVNHVIEFENPYIFEGKTYEKVDVSRISELNSMNMSAAENQMTREGFFITATQFNFLYACIIASMAAGVDEKFFTELPIGETLKIKNAVNDSDFFE